MWIDWKQKQKDWAEAFIIYTYFICFYLCWWLRGKESTCQYETQEMWVQSLGWEDTLEKELAAHSSIPLWEIPWTKGPGRLQFKGLQTSQTRLSD